MTQQTVLFIGSQGSGKGTQARLLTEYLEAEDPETPVFYFGTGTQFREFAQKEGYTNELVSRTLDTGEIQPVFLPIWLWTEGFVNNLTGNEHIVLDGSPRTKMEAQVLDSALRFYAREKPLVIELVVSEEQAVERILSRGRVDDTKEAIQKRLRLFHENTVPALEHLKADPYYTTVSVDAEQTPEEIHNNIREILSKRI